MAYRMVARGDPGFFGSIGCALGSVARAAVNVLSGPVGAVARTVLGNRPPVMVAQVGPGGAWFTGLQISIGGGRGFTATGPQLQLGGGGGGGTGRKIRRINPGNAKAACRAIRRIKLVRNLLKGIERQMPRRPCNRPHRKTAR